MQNIRFRNVSGPKSFATTIETLESRRLLSGTPISVLIGGGNGQFLSFVDANGNQDRYTVTGGGTASIQLDGTGLMTAATAGGSVIRGSGITVGDIALTGTRASTRLILKVGTGSPTGGGAPVKVGSITTDGSIGFLEGNVDVTGPISISGSVNKVQVTGIDGPGSPANFTAASINSLTVFNNDAESINVSGSIGNVSIGGNLTGGFSATSIRNLSVSGNMTGSTISLSQSLSGARLDLRSLKVAGPIASSTITSVGSIGPIFAGSLSGDVILAGISTTTTLPTSASQIVSQASITSVIVHGFSSTNIAADRIGRVTLGAVQTSNGGTPFGIAGASVGPIGGTASINGKTFLVRRVNNQVTANTLLGRYGLNATGVDFTVRVL